MGDSRSVAGRAALAVGLMIGFYGLALSLAGFLAWLPWAEWHYADRIHPKLAFFCLGGAYIILQSIVPKPDKFEAPGPRLIEGKQRRLFTELRGIARSTAQEMPAEVYLVGDVNAWVSQRGGFMGFGSRRVMGLGLPLLQVLTVSQLRAVLAHEFGHYHGGDVKVGPWIYKTRQALVRTLQGLAGHSGILSKPFEWYAALFFRVTHAVSRHQELLADALAARVAGASALAGGLRAVHAAALAYGGYWAQEVSPVLSAGFLPPLALGFGRLLDQPKIAEQLRQAVDEEARSGKSDPFDTHPSLQERIAALRGAPQRPVAGEDPAAITLVDGLADVEKQLLASLADREKVRQLKPVTWDEVGPKVLVPRWEAFVREHSFALAGVTPASLATLDWTAVGRKVAQSMKRADAEPLPVADYAVGAGLAVALSRKGFAVEAPPGAPVSLVEGDGAGRVSPFSLRETLASDPAGAAAWRDLCVRIGIADADLGRIALDKVNPPA